MDKIKQEQLQSQLRHLKEDFERLGGKVYLDISNLGTHINSFMDKIHGCDFIFLIGTPALKKRLEDTKSPKNNAQYEFDKILEKLQASPDSLVPLMLEGNRPSEAFPAIYFGRELKTTIRESLIRPFHQEGDDWIAPGALSEYIDTLSLPGGDAKGLGIIPALYGMTERNNPNVMAAYRGARAKLIDGLKSIASLAPELRRFYQTPEFVQLLGETPHGTPRETRLDDNFINLMVVKREEQKAKEKQLREDAQAKEGNEAEGKPREEGKDKREQHLSSFESIMKPKEPIELTKMFPEGDLSLQTPEQDRRLLIEGRAGVGKTTLSKYLSYQWAKGEAGILPHWQRQFAAVIFIRLRSLLDEERYPQRTDVSMADVVLKEFELHRHGWDATRVREALTALEQRPVLYVLDGFDEVAEQIKRPPTHLRELFRQLWEQPYWITTSRPSYVTASAIHVKAFKQLENIGFLQADVERFIERYVDSVAEEEDEEDALKTRVKELKAYVLENPNLRAIASIPINLEWLCAIPADERKAQDTLSDVYDKMVDARVLRHAKKANEGHPEILEKLDLRKERKAYTEDNYAKSLWFLAELGWRLMTEQRLITATGDFQIEDIQQREAAEIALRGLGVVQPFGHASDWKKQAYYFVHLTFQEFAAANHWVGRFCSNDFVSKRSAIQDLARYRYHPRFEVVWRFAAGLLAKRYPKHLPDFWKSFQGLPKEKIGLVEKLFISGCLGECYGSLPAKERASLVQTLEQWIEGKRIEIGFELLMQTLGQYANVSIALQPLILKLLKERKGEKRLLGCRIIQSLSNALDSAVLLDALIQALGDSRNDGYGYARQGAAQALGQLPVSSDAALEGKRLDALIQALGHSNNDEYGYARKSAAHALGQLPVSSDAALEGKRLDALIQALGDDKWPVCQGAAQALGQLPVSSDAALEGKRLDALIQALGDKDGNNSYGSSQARQSAAQALGQLPVSSDATLEGKRLDHCH